MLAFVFIGKSMYVYECKTIIINKRLLNMIEIRVLLTQKEAAEYLGTTVGTLNGWRHYGKNTIPFVRWGRSIRYRKEDLDAWIASHVITNS